MQMQDQRWPRRRGAAVLASDRLVVEAVDPEPSRLRSRSEPDRDRARSPVSRDAGDRGVRRSRISSAITSTPFGCGGGERDGVRVAGRGPGERGELAARATPPSTQRDRSGRARAPPRGCAPRRSSRRPGSRSCGGRAARAEPRTLHSPGRVRADRRRAARTGSTSLSDLRPSAAIRPGDHAGCRTDSVGPPAIMRAFTRL